MEKINIPDNITRDISEIISSRFGTRLDSIIVMNNISNSISSRMNILDINSPIEYFKTRIINSLYIDEELKELFNIISVNETFFFRIPEHFDALEHFVIPQILMKRSATDNNAISIWSAGCSTGEEPYTIAIVCNEIKQLMGNSSFTILGSDQDGCSVSKASDAVYSERSVQKTPPRLLEKYWSKHDNSFRLNDNIKSFVNFEKHNLNIKTKGDPFDRKWDIIFCRNVLIYLKQESSEVLMKRFHECLSSPGYLILGPWETQHCPQNLFETVMEDGIFIFKKKETDKQGIENGITGTLISLQRQVAAMQIEDVQEFDEPLSAARHYERGNSLLETGAIEDAYKELLKTISIDPAMTQAYILLAVILRSRKQFEEAEQYLKKALYHDALCIPALFYMGNIHLDSGKIEKGIFELEFVKKLLAGNKQILHQETLGEINPESLLQTCNRLIKINSCA